MERNIRVTQRDGRAINDVPVEMVERKGLGHPDSLCDGIAERISRDYCRWCEDAFGQPLHHNFDKVQLAAGEASVEYGGGRIIRPMLVQIAGRGLTAFKDEAIPLDTIAEEAARGLLGSTVHCLDPVGHVDVTCSASHGATELVRNFESANANDTSFGVSHWPLSRLERTVLETARYLNGPLVSTFPIGEDIKVMGCRVDGDITLTASVPFLAERIADASVYESTKHRLAAALQNRGAEWAGGPIIVDINTADDIPAGVVYLTLTGTSAECGDDGAVGRGNRVNGLITPFRPTSLEAACGKNPVTHVGKIYNVLALWGARHVVDTITEVCEAEVFILSQIGRPVDRPFVINATVRTDSGTVSSAVANEVAEVLESTVSNPGNVYTALRNGELTLF